MNNPSFRLLERTLDASTLRQKVIANNVANVDTPYFKRSDVVFEELLQQHLQGQAPLEGRRTNAKHLRFGSSAGSLEPQLSIDDRSVMNNNMNNVDIDAEMSLLAKNQLRYNVISQQISEEIKQLRIAMDGRK